MTAKELKRIFQKGECLSLDTMRLYNEGKLNKKSMHELEKHLLECGLCSGAVDGLNQKRLTEVNKLTDHIQRRLAVYMNTPPKIPFFRRFAALIIAGFILLVGSCSLWFFTGNNKTEKSKTSEITQPLLGNPSESGIISNAKNELAVSQPQSNSTTTESFQANDNTTKAETPNTMQNLPADLPGKQNTLTVGHSTEITNENSGIVPDNSKPIDGSNSRIANSNQLIHIKSVQVYPPVTLDKSSRKESKDGQIGGSSSSEASFQIDQMPTYPGGDVALKSFITTNFKPTAADRTKISRFATGVMFVVNAKTGTVSSPEISFQISPEIDAELMRVIGKMPNWNPGKKRGEVQVMLGITFE